ncbi:MAG: tetratricopeptide repeat protein, partial [Planctomycetota bacterium]
MSDLAERISRFEHMAEADPENDMAHFSLGNAYLQAERFAEAAGSLERCLELNPAMSKAFQLAGEAMIKAGWEDKAVATLEKGYEVAAARGDLLPRDAMAELLTSIGRTPPAL